MTWGLVHASYSLPECTLPSRRLQAKGEMSTLQTGKLLQRYQYRRPCACVCAELHESSISRLSHHYNVSCSQLKE